MTLEQEAIEIVTRTWFIDTLNLYGQCTVKDALAAVRAALIQERAAREVKGMMTREEAIAIVFGPLPDFASSMMMPRDEWRALVRRNMEAMRVLWKIQEAVKTNEAKE